MLDFYCNQEWSYPFPFLQGDRVGGGGREGLIPIMAYTGRLNPNVVTFSGVGSHEGVEISRVEEYRRVENSVISFCET